MKRVLSAAVLSMCAVAFAEAPSAAAPAGMDMSKMGPWTRKPTDEKKTKKEIEEFFKKVAEAEAKGDHDAMVNHLDFPLFMATDDMKGTIEAKPYAKDEYVAMMKPFQENMPKDIKWTHKPTITVLSDNMASVVDEFTMMTGKNKMAGRNHGLLVKVGSDWKWKSMTEAGWGGMAPPPAAAPAKPAAPAAAPTPAPKK